MLKLLASVMEKLTKVLYEPKLVYFSRSFDDQVRTFCVSPYGEVTTESYDGVLTVNGGSHAETKTDNTNFAILVSTSFTEPFKEPIAYGKYIARLSNLLSGGVMVQRLGDLNHGRRSTPERLAHSVLNTNTQKRHSRRLKLRFTIPLLNRHTRNASSTRQNRSRSCTHQKHCSTASKSNSTHHTFN